MRVKRPHTKSFVLFFSLASIIFISACTMPEGISLPFFVGGTTKIVSKDLLKINSIDVFPSTTVNAGDTLILRMEVENVGQVNVDFPIYLSTETSTKIGRAILTDFCEPLYTVTSMALFPTSTEKISGNKMTLKPGDVQSFQWTITAPSSETLFGIEQYCTFKFLIDYTATAQTNTYVYFATPLEISQKIYTKEQLTLQGDSIATYGPIAVNIQTPSQPVPASSGGKWTFYINIKNVGAGITDVDETTFSIKDASGTKITCDEDTTDPTRLTKYNLLRIIKESSSTFPCTTTVPSVTILDSKLYTTQATYDYLLLQEITIKTKPRGLTITTTTGS